MSDATRSETSICAGQYSVVLSSVSRSSSSALSSMHFSESSVFITELPTSFRGCCSRKTIASFVRGRVFRGRTRTQYASPKNQVSDLTHTIVRIGTVNSTLQSRTARLQHVAPPREGEQIIFRTNRVGRFHRLSSPSQRHFPRNTLKLKQIKFALRCHSYPIQPDILNIESK